MLFARKKHTNYSAPSISFDASKRENFPPVERLISSTISSCQVNTFGGSCRLHFFKAASADSLRAILSSRSLTACFTSVSIASSCHSLPQDFIFSKRQHGRGGYENARTVLLLDGGGKGRTKLNYDVKPKGLQGAPYTSTQAGVRTTTTWLTTSLSDDQALSYVRFTVELTPY